jgi:hypothetical protein
MKGCRANNQNRSVIASTNRVAISVLPLSRAMWTQPRAKGETFIAGFFARRLGGHGRGAAHQRQAGSLPHAW